MKNNLILQSVITCPVCGHQKEEIMPVDPVSIFMSVKNVKQS